MKRDVDLVRDILLYVEERAEEGKWLEVSIEGHSQETTNGHIRLICDAGLVEAVEVPTHDTADVFRITGLTPDGHDFLDAARNDTVWRKVMSRLTSVGENLSIELLKRIVIQAATGGG